MTPQAPQTAAPLADREAIPDVPTYALQRHWGWALYLVCPLCGDVHQHSGGTGLEPDYGHRVAHCAWGDGGGYWLVPGLATMPERMPYRERLRRLLADDQRRGIGHGGRAR